MARKKKININPGPLQSVTIGKINEHKFSFAWVIFFVGFFMAIIFYMPQINGFIGKYLNVPWLIPNDNSEVDNKTSYATSNLTENSDNTTNENVSNKYKIASDLSIEYETLIFKDFNKEQNNLNFNIYNNNELDIPLSNLFLETYDEGERLLDRIMIKGNIEAKNNKIFTYKVSNFDYFMIKKIEEKDYAKVLVEQDEEQMSKLTCINENSKIIYNFRDDKLVSLTDYFTYYKSNVDYDLIHSLYNNYFEQYKDKSGLRAIVNDYDDRFEYSLKIDYKIFSDKIENDFYFKSGDNIYKINFEMESQYYTCD